MPRGSGRMTRGHPGSLLLSMCGVLIRCSMPVYPGAHKSRLVGVGEAQALASVRTRCERRLGAGDVDATRGVRAAASRRDEPTRFNTNSKQNRSKKQEKPPSPLPARGRPTRVAPRRSIANNNCANQPNTPSTSDTSGTNGDRARSRAQRRRSVGRFPAQAPRVGPTRPV
jgi:hypothetical protein